MLLTVGLRSSDNFLIRISRFRVKPGMTEKRNGFSEDDDY